MKSYELISLQKEIVFLMFVISTFAFTGCNNHSDHSKVIFTNAVSYNEYIISRQRELMEDINMFNLASEHDYPFAIKLLDTLLLHSTQNIEDIRILAPFYKDSAFKEAAIDEFNFYNNIFVPCSRIMIAIKMKIDSATALQTDYDNYNNYLKKIKRQSEPIESRLTEIQARFAKKNNIFLAKAKDYEDVSQ